MATPDGGPAFPTSGIYRADGVALDYGNPGLTKREWLAGLAMQAMVMEDIRKAPLLRDAKFAAGKAVQYADALLEELVND